MCQIYVLGGFIEKYTAIVRLFLDLFFTHFFFFFLYCKIGVDINYPCKSLRSASLLSTVNKLEINQQLFHVVICLFQTTCMANWNRWQNFWLWSKTAFRLVLDESINSLHWSGSRVILGAVIKPSLSLR